MGRPTKTAAKMRKRYLQESYDERMKRLEANRERVRITRSMESSDQREERLAKMRSYYKQRAYRFRRSIIEYLCQNSDIDSEWDSWYHEIMRQSTNGADSEVTSSGHNKFCGVEQDIMNPITSDINVLNSIKNPDDLNMLNANTIGIKKELKTVEGDDNLNTLIKDDSGNLDMLNANTIDIKKELNTVEGDDNLNTLIKDDSGNLDMLNDNSIDTKKELNTVDADNQNRIKDEPLKKKPRGRPRKRKTGPPKTSNKTRQEQLREAAARYRKAHPEAVRRARKRYSDKIREKRRKASELKKINQRKEKSINSDTAKKSRVKNHNEDMKMSPVVRKFLDEKYLFLKPIKTVSATLMSGRSNRVKKRTSKIKEDASETSQSVEHGRVRRPRECKLKSMEKAQDIENINHVVMYIKTEAIDDEYIIGDYNATDTIESIGKVIKTEPEDEYDTAAESDRKIEYITLEVPLGDTNKTEVIDEFEVKTVVKMEIDIEPEFIH